MAMVAEPDTCLMSFGVDPCDDELSDGCDLPVMVTSPFSGRDQLTLSDCFEAPVCGTPVVKSPVTVDAWSKDTAVTMADLCALPSGEHAEEGPQLPTSVALGGYLDLDTVVKWHPNRIWALVWEDTLKNNLPLSRRRLPSKGFDWRAYLNVFVRDAFKKTLMTGTGIQRSRARDVFRRVLAKYCGASWRKLNSVCKVMWSRASEEDKFKWYALGCAGTERQLQRSLIGTVTVMRVKGREFPSSVDPKGEACVAMRTWEGCTGVMLTYNLPVGLRDPEVLLMVQEKRSPGDFQTFFAQSPLHLATFETFWSFLLTLGEQLKFRTVGGSMELSENAQCPGRVHLHAYLGTNIKGGHGAICSIVRADVSEKDLIFMDTTPHVRPTQPRKNHPKTVCDAVVNGLYYVIALKTTSIMRRATLWPILDRCGRGKGWARTVQYRDKS
jgi:hypothetical protein